MLQIALLGIISVFLAIVFRSGKSEYSLIICIVGCVMIFSFGIGKLSTIMNAMEQISHSISINTEYLSILLKIIGITYIAEFSSNLCKDAGFGAVGNQIEFAGKLSIMAISMPVLLALLETIQGFLQT